MDICAMAIIKNLIKQHMCNKFIRCNKIKIFKGTLREGE